MKENYLKLISELEDIQARQEKVCNDIGDLMDGIDIESEIGDFSQIIDNKISKFNIKLDSAINNMYTIQEDISNLTRKVKEMEMSSNFSFWNFFKR